MSKNKKIEVLGTEITVVKGNHEDYISLTDIARHKYSAYTDTIIQNWLRNRNTIELLGIWEQLHNPDFKPLEFEGFRKQAGLNSFVLTPKKWIETTNAIGIISKSGRYGGTFAHRDIAFEFASWISIEFKLYVIKEFQRLKEEESNQKQLQWNLSRELAKVNYRIHTDAIKANLVPEKLPKSKIQFVYASEGDLLNMALFGQTAAEWRKANPELEGNMRDYATLEQLVVLSNLESHNAVLIDEGQSPQVRLQKLNDIAIRQMKSLTQLQDIKRLN